MKLPIGGITLEEQAIFYFMHIFLYSVVCRQFVKFVHLAETL